MAIAPALRALIVPVDAVEPHPRNARQGDVGAVATSLDTFGQVRPILVQRSTGYIVAGNHVWRAVKSLGWAEIAAVMVDFDDQTALRYLIADNRTQELGTYDQDVLLGVLTELAGANILLGTGYDGDDVDLLLKRRDLMLPEPGDAPVEQVPPSWGVVIEVPTEREQLDLLARFGAEGLRVRALIT